MPDSNTKKYPVCHEFTPANAAQAHQIIDRFLPGRKDIKQAVSKLIKKQGPIPHAKIQQAVMDFDTPNKITETLTI